MLSLPWLARHGAEPVFNLNDMMDVLSNFPLCGGCSHKEKGRGLKDGEYFCSIAEVILPTSIVTDDVDATGCVKNGWYRPASLDKGL